MLERSPAQPLDEGSLFVPRPMLRLPCLAEPQRLCIRTLFHIAQWT